MIRKALLAAALACPLPALACAYPDEGNMPLRRAPTRVQMIPEVDAWDQARRERREPLQYRLHLDETVTIDRRCYWTVEALGDGQVRWRFHVSPDGKHIRPAPR